VSTGSELPSHETRNESQHLLALIGLVRIESCQDHEMTFRGDDAPRRHEFMTIADNAKSARQLLETEAGLSCAPVSQPINDIDANRGAVAFQ
jgi:hypothetical protein